MIRFVGFLLMLMMLSSCSNNDSVPLSPSPLEPEEANAFCDGEFPVAVEELGRSIYKNAKNNPETIPLWRETIISGTQVVKGHEAGCNGD